jgi:hypothetical protein
MQLGGNGELAIAKLVGGRMRPPRMPFGRRLYLSPRRGLVQSFRNEGRRSSRRGKHKPALHQMRSPRCRTARPTSACERRSCSITWSARASSLQFGLNLTVTCRSACLNEPAVRVERWDCASPLSGRKMFEICWNEARDFRDIGSPCRLQVATLRRVQSCFRYRARTFCFCPSSIDIPMQGRDHQKFWSELIEIAARGG